MRERVGKVDPRSGVNRGISKPAPGNGLGNSSPPRIPRAGNVLGEMTGARDGSDDHSPMPRRAGKVDHRSITPRLGNVDHSLAGKVVPFRPGNVDQPRFGRVVQPRIGKVPLPRPGIVDHEPGAPVGLPVLTGEPLLLGETWLDELAANSDSNEGGTTPRLAAFHCEGLYLCWQPHAKTNSAQRTVNWMSLGRSCMDSLSYFESNSHCCFFVARKL